MKKRVEGLNPFWSGGSLKRSWAYSGIKSPSLMHNLSQTSELFFAGNHIKTLKIVVKILVPNLQIYIKNMSVKYCRNERFKGLETIMQTEWQTNNYNSFERFAFWSQLLDLRRGIPRLSSKCYDKYLLKLIQLQIYKKKLWM